MSSFEKEKRDFLGKPDKSTKGFVDEEIKGLLEFINSLPDYFTTSSCSGRIVLLTSQEKRESEWLFVSHLPVASLEIKRECWFLQEPPVVHVRCRTLEAAEGMLALAQMGGLKRSGLVSFKKLVLEIKSAEKMETFVTPGLDREYVSLLLEKANEKLLRGRRNLEMFEKGLRRVF